NSYFGVKKGDALLCEVARYLYHDYKMCEVFRLEGDWFAVIIKGKLLHNMTMRDLSEKICSIPKVWKVGDNEIPLTASKVCLDSNDFDDFREMIALLTYASALEKQSGQDGFMIVNGDIKAQYIRRRRVESVLERAIEEGTIDVAYQPICSVETGRIVSAEALARLHDDELGNIPPSEFISIAEHNGMISSIGDIVRRKVCAFIAEQKLWQLGIKHVAVNLSVVECMQSDLHRKIIDDAQKYGTPLHMMRFEITESTAVESISVLRHNMEELIGNGISFHLDDYGTGYSNLSMILSLPFSVIKLDRSILHSTGDMGSDYPMHLSALFSELGMEVVCEGIEDAQQAERLRRWKVDYGQGWYYGKPLTPDAFVCACKAFAVCDA
ncbi:MAG: EAL domain-containing protein, partial [Clostridia bacterium]|nr:EAL domain-containing protein [Clostridia bacterium]